MKIKPATFFGGVILILLVSAFSKGFSQTNGTMTLSVTTTAHTGQYNSSHVVAIWIQYGTGGFLKTKLRDALTNHTINNHLPVWKLNNPKKNTIDAVVGATLTNYSTPLSVTWNATDTNNSVVPDGVMKVIIEESWEEGTSGHDTISVKFMKGTSPVHLTPAGNANFTGIVLDWNPLGTSVQENAQQSEINVFPNPTTGLVNIDLKDAGKGSNIMIENQAGQLVYSEKVPQGNNGIKTIDLSNFSNGVYFVKIQNDTQSNILKYKIVLNR
jgi:hypothetical protein